VVQVERLALGGAYLPGEGVERGHVREAGRAREVAVDGRRARRGGLLGITGRVAAAARPLLPLAAAVASALALVALPGIAVLPLAAAAASPAALALAVSLPSLVSAALLGGDVAGSPGVLVGRLLLRALRPLSLWPSLGTKTAGGASSRAVSASPSALRARGLPRFAGFEPSSGADISSSVLGGRDIGVFCKGCACLGSVQGVHDAVDL